MKEVIEKCVMKPGIKIFLPSYKAFYGACMHEPCMYHAWVHGEFKRG
jgi:hypothetical protein